MTIVAAKLLPDGSTCRAAYVPKSLDPDSIDLPEEHWRTSRTDDSVENQLRRADIVSTARPRQSTRQGSNGLSYQVQYRANLLQPGWFNLGPPIIATNSALSLSDTNALQSSPQRFYRLIVAP